MSTWLQVGLLLPQLFIAHLAQDLPANTTNATTCSSDAASLLQGRVGVSSPHSLPTAENGLLVLFEGAAAYLQEKATQTIHNPIVACQCVGAVAVIMGIVVALYWQKGFLVICKVMIYLLSLVSIKSAVRLIEGTYLFGFPLFVTGLHFGCSTFVALVMLLHGSQTTDKKMAAPSVRCFLTRFAPIAGAFAMSVAMANTALVHSTLAFVEIVGNTQPLFTMMLMLIMKEPVNMQLFGPLLFIVLGCALTSKGTSTFSWLGLFLAAGANAPRSLKSVLQHKLLKNETSFYSPLEVLAWTCLPSSLIMLVWSLCQEGLQPYTQWYQHGFLSQLTLALLVSCLIATILNAAVLFVIKDLGAVGSQIVAQTKSILVVTGGMIFLDEKVTRFQWSGLALMLMGLYMHNRLESNYAKAQGDGANAMQARK